MVQTNTLLVISDHLTIGQVTFISRASIEVLSFAGVFLLGLIILGSAPTVAPSETHDTLNRIVGDSTVTKKTILWIKNRLFNRQHDHEYRSRLLLAFTIFLCYKLFVTLTDVGFLGLQGCSVPFPSFYDFPASIRSASDARALVSSTMMNGTDPNTVKSFRCDSSQASVVKGNQTAHQCTSWSNSTYGEASSFSSLNLTDTDVLMFKNLGHPQLAISRDFPVYYLGAMGSIEPRAKISDGLAVIPRPLGVQMIVGSSNLGKNQSVTIQKTSAVDVSFGCLPLGLFADKPPHMTASSSQENVTSYLIPDSFYKLSLKTQYTGPDTLFDPLSSAAESVRQLVLSTYNQSTSSSEGYLQFDKDILQSFTWRTQVQTWLNTKINFDNILSTCGDQVHAALGVTAPKQSLGRNLESRACDKIVFSGSLAEGGNIRLRSKAMICASATSISMVEAKLETDGEGQLAATLKDLPSDLHELTADMGFNSVHDSIKRFTLSENPSGNDHHYILQNIHKDFARPMDINGVFTGSESVGSTISQLGNMAIGVWLNQGEELVIDGTFFSFNDNDDQISSMVTKWAGEYTASIMLSSFAFVGYAALDKPRLTIESKGGKMAACYQPYYIAGFIPLLLAALVIFLWSFFMLVTSKLRGVVTWLERYGGLAPAIVSKSSSKVKPGDTLRWEEFGEKTHLLVVSSGSMDSLADDEQDNERTVLVCSNSSV